MQLVRIALMPHPGKSEAMELAKQLIERFNKDGVEIWLDRDAARKMDRSDLAGEVNDLKGCQVALVLGGDGALLKAARIAAPLNVPVLGINFGQLGFLMATEPSGIDSAIEKLYAGSFYIEERLMVEAVHLRQGREIRSLIGLNDAVVTRGPFARVVEFEVAVGGSVAGRFSADGVIVSTPTGSTGYSLSAGGPIVSPGVEALIVTPICPHTIGARGFVTRPDEEIMVRILTARDEAMLTVDGQVGEVLEPMDEVLMKRANQSALFVSFGERGFYQLLDQRLRQGNG